MVSVSEFAANSLAEKHSESTVNRQSVSLRDRDLVERSAADGNAVLNRVGAAAKRSAHVTSIKPGAYSHPVPVPVGGWSKRAFDFFVASTTLLLMAPLMLIIAAIILVTMGRPVLFVQQRVGFNRKVFGCFKFRSMVSDADQRLARYLQHCPEAARAWAETQKLKDDPRVTWFGHILRKSSLDELPQLFNVLRGEMSCIGPRPVPVKELNARYGLTANDYARAKPGLTGMWQVSGRSSTTYSRRVAYDRVYVRRWSLLLDMNILFRTVPALMKTDQTS
jgi:exopolysaccharide production protein ExoY